MAVLLCIITAIAYGQVGSFDFINYDDDKYISDNSRVQSGLSWESFRWAFGFSDSALEFYWHPITWLSLMLDVELFGLHAGGSHIVNVIFHAINAMLLFLALRLITGAYWKSAFVAALFAVHPLNVESVAWIAERKNVLSTFFWILCMLAYAAYAKTPDWKKYLLFFVPFILGLMAKPMLVTLPCVFLLLDFWPLKRARIPVARTDDQAPAGELASRKYPVKRLVMEKIPLLGVSLLSVAVSVFSYHQTRQIARETVVPLTLRLENVVVVYVKYLYKLAWPHDMAIFYPYPESIPAWQVIAAGATIVAITAAALLLIKKAPYLIVGWLWYLGTLLPIIGLFQLGRWPEMADRMVYVPAVGLFIGLAWAASDLLKKFLVPLAVAIAAAGLIIACLMLVTINQLPFWQNSKTIFAHTLDVTENNWVAHYNYGYAMREAGNLKQVVTHYKKALALKPCRPKIHNDLGSALGQLGRTEQAIYHFKQAIQHYKAARYSVQDRAAAHYNLANAYGLKREKNKALAHFKKAQSLNPDYPKAPNIGALISRLQASNTKNNLFKQAVRHVSIQEYEAAIKKFKAILDQDPANQVILYNMACIYSLKGKELEALSWLKKAVSNGYKNWERIKTDPDLKNLRKTEYYQEIIKRVED